MSMLAFTAVWPPMVIVSRFACAVCLRNHVSLYHSYLSGSLLKPHIFHIYIR